MRFRCFHGHNFWIVTTSVFYHFSVQTRPNCKNHMFVCSSQSKMYRHAKPRFSSFFPSPLPYCCINSCLSSDVIILSWVTTALIHLQWSRTIKRGGRRLGAKHCILSTQVLNWCRSGKAGPASGAVEYQYSRFFPHKMPINPKIVKSSIPNTLVVCILEDV